MAPPTSQETLRAEIFGIVAAGLKKEAESLQRARRVWRAWANGLEAASHVCVFACTVLIFVAGYFFDRGVAFSAGCTGVVAVALRASSGYCNRESAERTIVFNRILGNQYLAAVPNIVAETDPGAEGGRHLAAAFPPDAGAGAGFPPGGFGGMLSPLPPGAVLGQGLPLPPGGWAAALAAAQGASRAGSPAPPPALFRSGSPELVEAPHFFAPGAFAFAPPAPRDPAAAV
jgi:hypothetical protein